MKASSLLLVLLFTAPISAQITVTGLTEMQRGEVPGSDSTAISTAYNQVNLDFTQKDLQAGLRAEIYNTWGADRETYQITQKYARWNRGAANVEIGNYYAILGRGLTLRAYELPGVVLESPLYRLRYAPAQDLEGATASWSGNRVEAKALIGRSALSDIPPGAKTGTPPRGISRRGDWVTGGELAIRLNSNLKIGSTGVHITPRDSLIDKNWAWSGFADLDLSNILQKAGLYGSLYGEYAKRENSEKGTALYLSGNVGGNHLGLSVEYKNYDNMNLHFNDPPSLIREHTASLLNRNTHVLLLATEIGYQIEGTYTQPGLGNFTVNISHARNDLAPTIQTFFKERHFSFDLYKFDHLTATFFLTGAKTTSKASTATARAARFLKPQPPSAIPSASISNINAPSILKTIRTSPILMARSLHNTHAVLARPLSSITQPIPLKLTAQKLSTSKRVAAPSCLSTSMRDLARITTPSSLWANGAEAPPVHRGPAIWYSPSKVWKCASTLTFSHKRINRL